MGQCPSCREWNTLEEWNNAILEKSSSLNKVIPISQAHDQNSMPFSSGMPALDHLLGGGIFPGASLLIGGEPGIGKSTLMLQICAGVTTKGGKALYASAEESLARIKGRAERLGALNQNLLGIAVTCVEDVLDAVEKIRPELLVADSAQTFASKNAEGLAGNASQTRAVASALADICRKNNCALALVGHVTKDGLLAGPKMLEHLVDTVISLEGDRRQVFRLLRIFKNRFGPNEELLVFKMEQNGLALIEDPSTFFLEDRDTDLSGTALVMAIDGQRPLVVEVQALVSRTFLNIPRRAALGFDVNRLHLLLAVMEKKLKLNFGQADIYARVGGGIRLQEPGIDLAIIAAILSSYYDLPLPPRSVFWGEVDLNGQIRPAMAHKARIAQAGKLGFKPVFCPRGEDKSDVAMVGNIMDLKKMLFKR